MIAGIGMAFAAAFLPVTATAQAPARSSAEVVFGMQPEEERKLIQQINQCEQEKRWQEMSALCYDAISRTQKQQFYDRLIVAMENQKRPSDLADTIFAYMLRFPSQRESKFTQWATAMREANRADEAVTQLRQWIESSPAEVAAWSALSALQTDLKLHAEAAATYTKALTSVRDEAAKQRLRLGLARLYVAMSDADRAIAAYDDIITIAPTIPGYSQQDVLTELGRLLSSTGRMDAYVATLETRLREPAKEKDTLNTLLGIIDQRTHPKAISYRRRLTELDPTRPAFLQLRELAERRSATNDEISVMESMFVHFPDTRASWQKRLLDLYVLSGDAIKAMPILEERLKEQTNALSYAQAAGTAMSLGDRNFAAKWLDEARKRGPDGQAMAAMARVFMRMDRHEDAMNLTLAIPSPSAGQTLRNEIMTELEKAGKKDLVLGALTKLTVAQPTNAVTWADLGRFHARMSDPTNAAAAWRRAVDIEPSKDAYQNWLSALRSINDAGALLRATEAFFKAFPAGDTGRALVPLLVKAGRTADALAVQKQLVGLLKTPAEKASAHLAAIRILVSEQKNAEAKELMEEAIEVDSSDSTKNEIAKIRAILEANERHEEFVKKAIDKADANPRDPGAQRSAAQALRITGHPDRAADYYRRALSFDDQTSTRWDLAYVLTASKQYRDAVKAYTDLLGRELTTHERDSAIKAIAESHDALGETETTLNFLAGAVDDIKTPYIKSWATARIQELRTARK